MSMILYLQFRQSLVLDQQGEMSKSVLRRKVAIIGCGPVGMLGSLLCEHLGIEYITLQKYRSPRSHPSAHWLSPNSKAILSQIPSLCESINTRQQPWQNFRYYRYLQSLLGHQLAVTDHFKPSIEEKLKQSVEIFGERPNHIPQNVLLETMYQRLRDKGNILFETEIREIRVKESQGRKEGSGNTYVLYDQLNNPVVQTQTLILCSGSNTPLRHKLPAPLSPITLQGQPNLLSILNLHFTSKSLASLLRTHSRPAMLHFLYTKKLIAILVNHSVQDSGTFVMQVPNYQPFVDLLDVYSAREIIGMGLGLGEGEELKDLEVVHVGKWKVQGLLADSMYKSGIFLAGDAAHAYPPAGGFGMNSGFQDINELIHALFLTQKNPSLNPQPIYTRYSQTRRLVNSQYLSKALQNFQLTKKISQTLGYSPNILDYFSKSPLLSSLLSFLPQNKSKLLEPVRLKAMALMYRRQVLGEPGLRLFWDQFDWDVQRVSRARPAVMGGNLRRRGQAANLYACQGEVDMEKIREIVGQVEEKNVKFFKRSKQGFEKAQKLISSDGNIVLQ